MFCKIAGLKNIISCVAFLKNNWNGNVSLDVNECLPNNGRGPCEGTCKNTDGSYKCYCGKGLKLDDNGRTCKGKPNIRSSR